jgi:hypothetical protein
MVKALLAERLRKTKQEELYFAGAGFVAAGLEAGGVTGFIPVGAGAMGLDVAGAEVAAPGAGAGAFLL